MQCKHCKITDRESVKRLVANKAPGTLQNVRWIRSFRPVYIPFVKSKRFESHSERTLTTRASARPIKESLSLAQIQTSKAVALLSRLASAWAKVARRLPASGFPQVERIISALKLSLSWLEGLGPRKDGRDPSTRAVQLAVILAELASMGLPLDADAIAAGVLVDAAEAGFLDYRTIEHALGSDVATLVRDIMRVRTAPQRLQLFDDRASSAIREWCVAFNDVRASVVEVVNRWDELHHINALPLYQRQSMAMEVLQVYAPLGHALGLGTVSSSMEDICFKVLFPEPYNRTAEWLECVIEPAERALHAAQKQLLVALSAHPQFSQLASGCVLRTRTKSLFSMMKKMVRLSKQGRQAGTEVFDLLGMRAVVQPREDLPAEEAEAAAVEACYIVKSVAQSLWQVVPDRSKDYISRPKPNGYRSMHLTVRIDSIMVKEKARDLYQAYCSSPPFPPMLPQEGSAQLALAGPLPVNAKCTSLTIARDRDAADHDPDHCGVSSTEKQSRLQGCRENQEAVSPPSTKHLSPYVTTVKPLPGMRSKRGGSSKCSSSAAGPSAQGENAEGMPSASESPCAASKHGDNQDAAALPAPHPLLPMSTQASAPTPSQLPPCSSAAAPSSQEAADAAAATGTPSPAQTTQLALPAVDPPGRPLPSLRALVDADPGAEVAVMFMELQVRTQLMDDRAETGMAAHSAYKGGLDYKQARQLHAWALELRSRLSLRPQGKLSLPPSVTALHSGGAPMLESVDADEEGAQVLWGACEEGGRCEGAGLGLEGPASISPAQALFDFIDKNGDGLVSVEELRHQLLELLLSGGGQGQARRQEGVRRAVALRARDVGAGTVSLSSGDECWGDACAPEALGGREAAPEATDVLLDSAAVEAHLQSRQLALPAMELSGGEPGGGAETSGEDGGWHEGRDGASSAAQQHSRSVPLRGSCQGRSLRSHSILVSAEEVSACSTERWLAEGSTDRRLAAEAQEHCAVVSCDAALDGDTSENEVRAAQFEPGASSQQRLGVTGWNHESVGEDDWHLRGLDVDVRALIGLISGQEGVEELTLEEFKQLLKQAKQWQEQ